jgi:hypothetical protein
VVGGLGVVVGELAILYIVPKMSRWGDFFTFHDMNCSEKTLDNGTAVDCKNWARDGGGIRYVFQFF